MLLKLKALFGVALVIAAFVAGWTANGWRIGQDLAEQREETVNAARELEQVSLDHAAAVARQYELERVVEEARNSSTTKEVIKYVQAPYSGKCELPNHWVRVDTESATGVPQAPTSPSKSDGAPSGFTDSDALTVIRDRNTICRAEIIKLKSLQSYVDQLLNTFNSD